MATSDIGVGLRVDGEQEFKKAITDINREVKLLTNEMKLVTETFKKNATSQEALRAKADALTDQITKQKEKIDVLQRALNSAEQEYGENSKQAQNWKNSLLIAQTQLAKMNNELDDVTQQMNEYGNETKDAAKYTKQTGDAMREADGGVNVFTNGIGALTVAMGNLISNVISKAINALTDFAKESIQLASDLEEVQNVVDVTFGEGADSIYSWAKTASTEFGLTALQAQQFTSRIGAGLKAMGITSEGELNDMSTTLAGLAGDLASFYNLSADETYTKIFSGVISGETEGLKALGVVMTQTNLEAFAMSQGITKNVSAMTAAEKAQLRYQYLLYATSDAQGDFARTSDSYANQTKILHMNLENLGATIGQTILPMLTQFTSGLNDLIQRLTAAFDEGGFKGLISEAMEIFAEFMEGLAEKMPEIAEFAVNLIITFVDTLTEDGNLARILAAGIRLIVELAAGLLAALPEIVSAVQTLVIDTAGEFMKPENLQPFLEAGKSLANAVWSGITSLLNTSIFGNFIRGMLNSAGLGFLGTLGSIETWTQPGRSVSTSNSNLYISTSSVTPSTVDYIVNKSRTIPALR